MPHHGVVRRALAAAILGISLWIGSLAWSGFLITRTVLDPDRSREVADALYEDETVRARLAANIAGAAAAALPPGVEVDRATLDAAATAALDSPAVEAVVVDAFVATHQAFLGEGEVPRSVDAGAFGAAARESLVGMRPELDGIIPAAPELAVELPTKRVPNFGPVRAALLTAVPILAALAAIGALLALGVTSNRPAILRRSGVWAIGLAAGVLLFAYGIPALADRFAPDQAEVIAALIGAMAASTRGPALTLAAAGVAGIAASFVWKVAPVVFDGDDEPPRREVRDRATATPARTPWTQRRDLPRPARPAVNPPVNAPAPEPTPVRRPPATDPTTAAPTWRPAPDGPARPPAPATGTPPAPTRVESAVAPQPQPQPQPPMPPARTAPAPGPDPATPRTRWVEGVGWVLESGADRIPESARWVPGVGYVVDET